MQLIGTEWRIEIEKPFNPPTDVPSTIAVFDGNIPDGTPTVEAIPPCNQFTVQGDQFSRAIREGGEPAVPLEDAIRNMAVIDAIFRSAASGRWEQPGS